MPIPVGAIIGGVAKAAELAGVGARGQDRRQVKQQAKLNVENEASAKRLADYEQQLKMQMWKDTNYGAQLEQADKAGVSRAAVLGGSGGGAQGASVSSAANATAADAAATQGAATNSMMGAAQLGLMVAQTENIKADTEAKKAGAGLTGEQTIGAKFQNDLNKAIDIDHMREAWDNAASKLKIESQKMLDEYNAWQAGSLEGRESDDKNSPIAKAIRAGWDKATTDLNNAKTEGNILKAKEIVENFEASLAKEGISPRSPWWAKLVGDLLNKTGLMGIIGGGKEIVKKAIK